MTENIESIKVVFAELLRGVKLFTCRNVRARFMFSRLSIIYDGSLQICVCTTIVEDPLLSVEHSDNNNTPLLAHRLFEIWQHLLMISDLYFVHKNIHCCLPLQFIPLRNSIIVHCLL